MKLLCLTLVACAAFADESFKPLFNGKDLSAFIVDTPGIWRVQNGVIVGSHAGLKYNDFLRTRKDYGDFELKLEFRLKDGIGNSGIQFRSKPVPNSHEVAGYQADIGEKYWGCLYDESRRRKVLAQASAAALASVDKAGWNRYVIRARGPVIELELNDIPSVSYKEPDPSVERTGFIALQVHSGPGIQVEFRNLMIRTLPPQ